MPLSKKNLDLVFDSHLDWMKEIKTGLERETIRVDENGRVSKMNHPDSLGHPLTNGKITLDFAEAQLEFVSSPYFDLDSLMQEMLSLESFANQACENEYFWNFSMPGIIDDESDIKIADFGLSAQGRLKNVYRLGIANRYGKKMQAINGIHVNFSFSNQCLDILSKKIKLSPNQFYFKTMRKYQEISWAVTYLLGASPCVDSSFMPFDKKLMKKYSSTYLLPEGISFRQSSLGYQNRARCRKRISFKNIDRYTKNLKSAMNSYCRSHAKIGLKDSQGNYKQLSKNILQIENEFYNQVRPKTTIKNGLRDCINLHENGVDYIELRNIDIDFSSVNGISKDVVSFLKLVFIYCVLANDYSFTYSKRHENLANQENVSLRGLKKNLILSRNSTKISLNEWLDEFLNDLMLINDKLNNSNKSKISTLLKHFTTYSSYPENTPAGKVLHEIQSQNIDFHDYALSISKKNKLKLEKMNSLLLPKAIKEELRKECDNSLSQAKSEHKDISLTEFDVYLKSYLG